MKWNKLNGKVRFKEAESMLKHYLEINNYDFFDINNELLLPYLTVIMEHLNKKIALAGGDDLSITDRVRLIYKIFDYGTKKILTKSTLGLVYELEISTKEDASPDNIAYDQDLFIFVWSNFLSSLCIRLKFLYSVAFQNERLEKEEELRQVKYPKGDTWEDYESWRTDIYPEDEEYDRTNWMRTTDAWGGHTRHSFCRNYRDRNFEE